MMNKVILSLSMVLIVFTLQAQTKLYNPTGTKKEQRVRKADRVSNRLCTEAGSSRSLFNTTGAQLLTPDFVAGALKLAAGVGLSVIEAHRDRFLADYTAKESFQAFYTSENEHNLKTLVVERVAFFEGSPDTHRISRIVLMPEVSADGEAFRYRVTEVEVLYSEARTTSNNSTIDIALDISITGIYKYQRVGFGQNILMLKGISVGRNGEVQENAYTGWFAMMPNTQKGKASGNYEISITVKEANPHKEKVEKILKFFTTNSEAIQEVAKVVIVTAAGIDED